jgi:hypothetical protein
MAAQLWSDRSILAKSFTAMLLIWYDVSRQEREAVKWTCTVLVNPPFSFWGSSGVLSWSTNKEIKQSFAVCLSWYSSYHTAKGKPQPAKCSSATSLWFSLEPYLRLVAWLIGHDDLAILFFQNKPATRATKQQYFSLKINQHQPSVTRQMNMPKKED